MCIRDSAQAERCVNQDTGARPGRTDSDYSVCFWVNKKMRNTTNDIISRRTAIIHSMRFEVGATKYAHPYNNNESPVQKIAVAGERADCSEKNRESTIWPIPKMQNNREICFCFSNALDAVSYTHLGIAALGLAHAAAQLLAPDVDVLHALALAGGAGGWAAARGPAAPRAPPLAGAAPRQTTPPRWLGSMGVAGSVCPQPPSTVAIRPPTAGERYRRTTMKRHVRRGAAAHLHGPHTVGMWLRPQ